MPGSSVASHSALPDPGRIIFDETLGAFHNSRQADARDTSGTGGAQALRITVTRLGIRYVTLVTVGASYIAASRFKIL